MTRVCPQGLVLAIALAVCPAAIATGEQSTRGANRAAQLAAKADEAREANRIGEAIALYRKAVAARPRWAEGWWNLGTLLYDADDYGGAATAFQRTAALNPKVGTAWVMLGLCEFQLGRFDAALAHIERGRRVGASADPQFRQVMLYHEALLLLGKSEFERAQGVLAQLAVDGVDTDEVTIALGLSVLRMRPSDLPEGESAERQIVRRAGLAAMLAARKQLGEAERAYEQLAADVPARKHVHYALGRYYVQTAQADKAVAAYERELRNSPDDVPSLLGIAAIKAETAPDDALTYAERAVSLNPRVPFGHYLLGSLLLHTDQTARAIRELETAVRAVSEDPGVYYALGRAYAKAGRTADAARARATFKRLTAERQQAAQQAPESGASSEQSAP